MKNLFEIVAAAGFSFWAYHLILRTIRSIVTKVPLAITEAVNQEDPDPVVAEKWQIHESDCICNMCDPFKTDPRHEEGVGEVIGVKVSNPGYRDAAVTLQTRKEPGWGEIVRERFVLLRSRFSAIREGFRAWRKAPYTLQFTLVLLALDFTWRASLMVVVWWHW